MTQLLTSVKSIEEAMLALYAGVDLIDLKDPDIGALGALNLEVVADIMAMLSDQRQSSVLISATIGEDHTSVGALISDIETYSKLGVDIIKLAVSEWFQVQQFWDEIGKLTNDGTKLVAVFFAEQPINNSLIPALATKGFYGAMLDTQHKYHSLLDVKTPDEISAFVMHCRQKQLLSGLAGSVNMTHIQDLVNYQPGFIGMRGGLCEQGIRTAKLSEHHLNDARQLLFECNTVRRQEKNLSSAVCN